MSQKLFVVLTEEYYGGNKETIRLFSTLRGAQDYASGIKNLDVSILCLEPDAQTGGRWEKVRDIKLQI